MDNISAIDYVTGFVGTLWKFSFPVAALYVGFQGALFSDAAHKEATDYQLKYGPQFQKASLKEVRENPFGWIVYRLLGQACFFVGIHLLFSLLPISNKIEVAALALFTALLTGYGIWAVSNPMEAHRYRGHKPLGSKGGGIFTTKQAVLSTRISGALTLVLTAFLFWLLRWHADVLC